MVTSIVERLSSVIVVIYGYRDSKQTNLTLPAVKTDLCCPCFTSSSSISSPHHHCASQITRESYPDSKSHPTNLSIIERCKKWRWPIKNGGNRLNEEKVDWKNEDFHKDHVNELKYQESSPVVIDDRSKWKPQKTFVVVVDLDSNNNDTNDVKSDTPSGSTQNVEMTSEKLVKASPVKLTFEGFESDLDGQSLQRRSLNQHQNASLDEESICSSKDTCSALTGKKSASLYFHQICDELPPFSSEQVYNNNNNNNKTNANNFKNTNTKKSSKPENNSDNSISNKNNIDTKCWETRTSKNSDLGENISASLESNLPGNQPNIGESTGGRRKQSLTVPEELKFHPHHSHHLLSSNPHQHHHHRHRVHRYGQHSRDASPEHSHIHQHCLRQYTPNPRHHTQQHHQRASSMGHQQLEHRSDEGAIEETAAPKYKTESSRSPSPLSTPSPSGSTSLQFFSRHFDDQSIGSSCSSSGIELEFTRKCTVSADSLLLHPDITGSSSDTGVTNVNLGGAMGGGSRLGHQYHHSSHPSYHHLSETVSGSTGTCLGRDEAKPMSSDSSLEAGKGYKAGLLLDPGSLVKRKISGSLSSDQIHDDLMFSDKVTLTPGTRSVSPKMIFTGKYRRDKNTSTNSPATSLTVTSKQVNPSEPLPVSPSIPTSGVSIPITSQPSTSQSPSTSEKRKASMANVVLSGPGRLARLLRRTHSAGCSKDVPSHALFLREKPMKHHATSAPTTEGEMGDKRRGRKQAPALEDMKQRLRFLRRRHTDSSIQSTNVRPTPEEAQKWSESFQLLMRNKYGATLFKAFLAREYSQENIEFWIACEEFKKVRPAKMPSKARKIYDDFVAVKSPKEINLDPNLRTNIFQSLTAPEEGTFDIAQRKIQGMLEQDAYLRFLQSELYRDLLVPSEPKKTDATCKYESGKLSPESHL